MMEGFCIPCQYGDHEEHIDYPERPAPGVMGGWHCPCKGECVEHTRYTPLFPADDCEAGPDARP
jgi:hypothetical protein